METITLKGVLPKVFSDQKAALHSEVWLADVAFVKGSTYLIEASSGRGKSTLCSYLLGYRRDYSGTLLFDDTDTMTYRVGDWVAVRRCRISMLFQELRLFPELTAMENVLIKNRLTDFKTENEISEWFAEMGIADKKDVKVGVLSFGQQQRIAMMRALVQPFDFIVADEPVSHLDDHNSAMMRDLLMREAKRQGAGVIMTSIGRHMEMEYDRRFAL